MSKSDESEETEDAGAEEAPPPEARPRRWPWLLLALVLVAGGAALGAGAMHAYAKKKAAAAEPPGQQSLIEEDLAHLIAGAEAYLDGDRIGAGSEWSETESPVIREAISSRQSELGVALRSTEGGAR